MAINDVWGFGSAYTLKGCVTLGVVVVMDKKIVLLP
jgi:hypothetical protein